MRKPESARPEEPIAAPPKQVAPPDLAPVASHAVPKPVTVDAPKPVPKSVADKWLADTGATPDGHHQKIVAAVTELNTLADQHGKELKQLSDQYAQSITKEIDDQVKQLSTSTVAAGPASADDAGGLLDVIRRDKSLRSNVSTVDSVELPSGVIATIFAAAEQADGSAGSYGSAAGADAPLPSPSPAGP